MKSRIVEEGSPSSSEAINKIAGYRGNCEIREFFESCVCVDPGWRNWIAGVTLGELFLEKKKKEREKRKRKKKERNCVARSTLAKVSSSSPLNGS